RASPRACWCTPASSWPTASSRSPPARRQSASRSPTTWRCSAPSSRSSRRSSRSDAARGAGARMTFGPAVGNVGMYVAREMLTAVPEAQRHAYLRMVEEISDLKYQLGVEVARQLPRLLAQGDLALVGRYLDQVKA